MTVVVMIVLMVMVMIAMSLAATVLMMVVAVAMFGVVRHELSPGSLIITRPQPQSIGALEMFDRVGAGHFSFGQ